MRKDRPQVLQILYSGLGGHGSVAFSLVEGDRDRSWHHQMLFYGIEPLKKEYAQKCDELGVSYEAVIKRGKHVVFDWLRVLRALRRLNPDTVILHSLTLVLPVALYCRLLRKKLVVVEHTPNQVKNSNERKASHLAMRLAHCVVLLTENYREELQALLGAVFRKEKVTIINNGINVDRFCPASKPPTEIRIGMAGRFTQSKDFEGLVRAFHLLVQQTNDPRPRLVLAGNGATWLQVKQLVTQLGLEQQVTFAGNLNEPELVAFLQSLTIYAHASKGETMSTAIMQAMACGLPVVASDIPGINNLVNGKNGLLYKPGNAEELAENLELLLNEEHLRSVLANNARTFAQQNLSHFQMFCKYQQII